MSKQTEGKWTPGPWSVMEKMPLGGGIGIGPELEGIGPHAVVTFNGGESEANARLIAAAPEMVEEAEAMVLDCPCCMGVRPVELRRKTDGCFRCMKMRAILHKAGAL